MRDEEFLYGRVKIKVGDITLETVDAIVNAANSSLLGGGGVDGAIHARGGPEILAECEALRETDYRNGLFTGQAVITTAGRLPARHVIHTVGPIYGEHAGREAELLAACYINSLRVAVENSLRSVSFPSISTGAFWYPKDEAAKISSAAINGFLQTNESVEEVRLVFFSQPDADVFIRHHAFAAVNV
jgi:O-acetyl-ADP-ribose deacetylase (regulator of RNase III)